MYLDLRAITYCKAVRSGDDRQARHCFLQRLAFSEMRHNRDIFPANTMAYDSMIPFNSSTISFNTKKRAVYLILLVLLIYWYIMGTHCQRWMPFQQPFLMADK
jgi:hypothetical protein